jgi:hypothetical protein
VIVTEVNAAPARKTSTKPPKTTGKTETTKEIERAKDVAVIKKTKKAVTATTTSTMTIAARTATTTTTIKGA